jgi:hypothetical protein
MIQSLAHEMNFDKGEAGPGKTSEMVIRKSLIHCPCREANVE